MAANRRNGGGNPPRPGAATLELLANPLNATLLKQLSEGPKRLAELRRDGAPAPQTTVRSHLRGLEAAELTALQPRDGSQRVTEWALTDTGRDILDVARALDRWLNDSPEGSVQLGSDAGKMAITALVGGWSSTILCLLAAGPMSLTELAECISLISYPSLERRLSAMRLAGQLQTASSSGSKGTPYEVTEWLQQGVAPLAAAVRWEYTHRPNQTVPLTRSDTEAAFLLALPLLQAQDNLSGTCRLGVQVDDEQGSHSGAIARVEQGKVVFCATSLEDKSDSWATGSPPDWAYAMLEARTDRLELDGDRKLANGLVEGLHRAMFGNGTRAALVN